MLKEKLGGRRILLNDDERRMLAVKGKVLNALATNWNKDVSDPNVAPDKRVPRAPLANHVVTVIATVT